MAGLGLGAVMLRAAQLSESVNVHLRQMGPQPDQTRQLQKTQCARRMVCAAKFNGASGASMCVHQSRFRSVAYTAAPAGARPMRK